MSAETEAIIVASGVASVASGVASGFPGPPRRPRRSAPAPAPAPPPAHALAGTAARHPGLGLSRAGPCGFGGLPGGSGPGSATRRSSIRSSCRPRGGLGRGARRRCRRREPLARRQGQLPARDRRLPAGGRDGDPDRDRHRRVQGLRGAAAAADRVRALHPGAGADPDLHGAVRHRRAVEGRAHLGGDVLPAGLDGGRRDPPRAVRDAAGQLHAGRAAAGRWSAG